MSCTLRSIQEKGFLSTIECPLPTVQNAKRPKPTSESELPIAEEFTTPTNSAPVQHRELILDAAQAHWHLDLLGLKERETNIRGIPHKGMSGSCYNGNFAMDLERVPRWQASGRGIYVQPNIGGTRASEITACTSFFIEYDDLPIDKQIVAWIELGLPKPTFQLLTGGRSVHTYWTLNARINPQYWLMLIDRLIAHAKGCDRSCKGANRMMRLAGGWYIDRNGSAIAQSNIIKANGNRYDATLFDDLLPPLPNSKACVRRARHQRECKSKNLRQIIAALDCIPRRVADSGTYAMYRNVLWGLVNACAEVGYEIELAIQLMEDHSPSEVCGWNVAQVACSGDGRVGAGTFWRIAKQYGWEGHHA